MITSFFNSGKGAGSGILYLTEKREPEAQVLRGDIEAQIQLIDSLDFKQRYLSGVHRFIETDLPDSTKNEIMDGFENMMFAGLSEEQKPPVLWVQHQEKGGTEFHFIIPEVEMQTGRKFTPFWHETDLKMVDAWKDTINHEYGFTDPKEPERKQTLTIPKNLPRSHKEAVEKIDQAITGMVNNGDIKNRDDVIKTLEGSGFEVTKKSKAFISIKDSGWKKPARLKGVFYGESFNGIGDIRETIERAGKEFREGAGERYRETKERLQAELDKRTERNGKRYGVNREAHARSEEKSHKLDEVLQISLDNVRSIDSPEPSPDGRGNGNESKSINVSKEPGRDSVPGRKDRPDQVPNREGTETMREGSGGPDLRRWLQAIKIKLDKFNDRTRETLTGWYRNINERIRSASHQLERASAVESSTNRRIGSQNQNLDGTIRDNQQSHKALAVKAIERAQQRNQEQGRDGYGR